MSRDPDDVYLTPCAEGASRRPAGTPRPAECWWSGTRFIGRVRRIMARKAAASKRRGGAARKSTSRRKSPGASRRTTSPRRRWSRAVTEHSDALTLEGGVFTSKDPRRIAASLKRSAERAPQGRSVSLRALHAHLLHQSRRKESAGRAEEDFDASQGRIAKAVREALAPPGQLGSCVATIKLGGAPTQERAAMIVRPQSSSSGAAWRGRQCRS